MSKAITDTTPTLLNTLNRDTHMIELADGEIDFIEVNAEPSELPIQNNHNNDLLIEYRKIKKQKGGDSHDAQQAWIDYCTGGVPRIQVPNHCTGGGGGGGGGGR